MIDLWPCKWVCLSGGSDVLSLPDGPWGTMGLRGNESAPYCWHSQKSGRDAAGRARWGRWPSQVFPLTDEIKENLGHARQVSGKQTQRDRARETNRTLLSEQKLNTQETQLRECREQTKPSERSAIYVVLEFTMFDLFVEGFRSNVCLGSRLYDQTKGSAHTLRGPDDQAEFIHNWNRETVHVNRINH